MVLNLTKQPTMGHKPVAAVLRRGAAVSLRGVTACLLLSYLSPVTVAPVAALTVTPHASKVSAEVYAAQKTVQVDRVGRLYAALARAQNAAATGDAAQLGGQLAQARAASLGLGGRYQAIASDIRELQRGAVVTAGQVQAVIGHLGQQEALGQGQKQVGPLALSARLGLAAGRWALPIQGLLLLSACGVAYLFRRVFGRRWALFWLGLAALLLPYALDLAFTLLGGLGAHLGWAPLRSLLALTGGGSGGWLLRGLCALLGLALWALHFWQVGKQFGVFAYGKAPVLSENKSGPWELD